LCWFSPQGGNSAHALAYKAVIDGMSGRHAPFMIIAGLVAGYATARFAGVLSDNLRNALFERSDRMPQGGSRERSSACP
jgi:hypothetical protein